MIAARWNLFRELGADGVVIPADASSVEPPQLGGEQTGTPDWWPKSQPDSVANPTVSR